MEILIKDVVKQGCEMLKSAKVTDAENDSWLLAEYVLGITRQSFYINPKASVDESDADRYLKIIKQRADKIPLQYITGTQEFMGYSFKVNENVLIPRQDTELLVEKAAEHISSFEKNVKVLDMCTGSGCIAVSIDKICKNAKVTAVDISHKALDIAKENSENNHADIEFIQSDMFENVTGKFDVIISNPPYIKTDEINVLMDEVKNHEPVIALDGDNDGLKFYRIIAENANEYLQKNGVILFEIGYDQGESVPEILREYKFKRIEVIKDLSGNDRVVIAGKE